MYINQIENYNLNYIAYPKQTKFVSFKQILLTDADKILAQKLVENNSAVKNKNELFAVFDKYLIKEAKLKVKINHSFEDFLQSMYVKFFELLDELKDENNILDKICQELNKFKPSKDDKSFDFATKSLNSTVKTKLNSKCEGTVGDFITEDNLPIYSSKKNDEELIPIKEELDNLIKNVELNDREIQILELVKQGFSILKIVNKLKINYFIVYESYQESIAKIQRANNKLPQPFSDWAEAFIKKFQIPKTKDDVITFLIKNPFLLATDINRIEEKIQLLKKDLANDEIILDETKYFNACLKNTQLFRQLPETTKRNVVGVRDEFQQEGLSLDVNKYLEACYKQPQLFCMLQKTIIDNVKNTIAEFDKEKLSLDPNKYLNACYVQPSLFCQLPKTIKANVVGVRDEFQQEGLSFDIQKYMQVCLRKPRLFCMLPKTIKRNVIDVVEEFKGELDLKSYLELCFHQPSYFYNSPATMIEHIKAYKYIFQQNENNDKHIMDKLCKCDFSNSTSLIYLQYIVKPQIKKQTNDIHFTFRHIKDCLKEYFTQHPTAQFTIKVPKGEMQENFIKVMQEYSIKDLNRSDAFIYEL